jgi:hypothetical protein
MNPLPVNKRFHIFNNGRNMKLKALMFVLLLMLLPLMQQSASAQAAQRGADESDILTAYNNSIYDAAVYKFSNLRPLKPLVFDPVTHTATVVTLTDYPYRVGTTTLPAAPRPVYLWVTAVPEVKDICQGYTSELKLRLQQLLGLHPGETFNDFVVIEVRQGDIFRPTTNPDPTSTFPCACPVTANCGEVFPAGVDPAHVNWLANQMLSSYVISESTLIPVGYPWTRLGYTYNWRPGADKYGASEYVIKPGSTIKVTQVIPYRQYCRSGP